MGVNIIQLMYLDENLSEDTSKINSIIRKRLLKYMKDTYSLRPDEDLNIPGIYLVFMMKDFNISRNIAEFWLNDVYKFDILDLTKIRGVVGNIGIELNFIMPSSKSPISLKF